MFNAGFNMKRKKFFANLGNIMITGLGVTFVCFTIYSVAMLYFLKTEPTMTRYTRDLLPDSEPQTETLVVKMTLL